MSQTGDDDDENEGGKSGQDNSTPSNDQIDDDVFQRFADRIANNPEQVLRYECGGTPLFYAVSDDVGRLLNPNDEGFLATRIPKCGNCGGSTRVFEFQIMPHAITVLEGDDEGFDGMDWGTIMAFTCKCVPKALDRNMVGYVEEHVSVQWEKQR
jgi:pre-rRNA-processing protein TSR4